MKHILITGAGSYIGTRFEHWLARWPEEYQVQTLDMQQDSWREHSFAGYDVVFHVAGIAHRKEMEENMPLYQKVNCDLAIETATKAKRDDVGQFVFLSSMSVYGLTTGTITAETPCCPRGPYGKSKLKAEEGLIALSSESFCISILRPPMVYGYGCRGNYTRLRTFALKTPLFPCYENERSMIYIDTLCEFVRQQMVNPETGIFFPQNKETIQTSEMVKEIANIHGHRIHFTKIFNPALRLMGKKLSVINKAFGSLVYDRSLSGDISSYQTCSFEESVRRSETEGAE